MLSIKNYRTGFDLILSALAVYSVIFIYSVRTELYDLFSKRASNPSFYLGIVLMIVIVLFYQYYVEKINSYKTKELSEEDKQHLATLEENIGHLKFAIISGFSAVIIGSLALINKIIPGFFITLVMTYYADQNY
jgi:hypothetical protein